MAIRSRQAAESGLGSVQATAPVAESVSTAPVTNVNNDGDYEMSSRARAAAVAKRAADAEAARKPTVYEAVFGSEDYRRGQAYRTAFDQYYADNMQGPFNLDDVFNNEDEFMRRYPDNWNNVDPNDINPGNDEL